MEPVGRRPGGHRTKNNQANSSLFCVLIYSGTAFAAVIRGVQTTPLSHQLAIPPYASRITPRPRCFLITHISFRCSSPPAFLCNILLLRARRKCCIPPTACSLVLGHIWHAPLLHNFVCSSPPPCFGKQCGLGAPTSAIDLTCLSNRFPVPSCGYRRSHPPLHSVLAEYHAV